MPSSRRSRLVLALACAAFLVSSVPWPCRSESMAQGSPSPEISWSSSIESARERLKDGNYDDAIAVLKPMIERKGAPPDSLRKVRTSRTAPYLDRYMSGNR